MLPLHARARRRPAGAAAPQALAAAFALAVWALCASPAAAQAPAPAQGRSNSGCTCLGDCGYSVGSLSAWCAVNASAAAPCGYEVTGPPAYWWDYCTPNVTAAAASSPLLADFSSIWTAVAVPAVALATAAAAGAGCAAAANAAPPRGALLWLLPAAAALVGGCQALFVAAVFAACIAFLYLSMPYALELSVAVSLGVALAAVLIYASLGRQYAERRPPHPSEFAE